MQSDQFTRTDTIRRKVFWRDLSTGVQLCCITQWVMFTVISVLAGLVGGMIAGAL